MTQEQLRDIAEAIRDLRFIQATAIVALRQQGTKPTIKYMDRLAVLQQLVEQEALK